MATANRYLRGFMSRWPHEGSGFHRFDGITCDFVADHCCLHGPHTHGSDALFIWLSDVEMNDVALILVTVFLGGYVLYACA